jgi:DNA polymerase-1
MTKTLLVDANNLLKIGFYGVKEFYHKGEHIGGIYHFLNTLRKFIEEQNFDKVVVMWDGDSNSSSRKLIYPKYKEQRSSTDTDQKKESFYRQKERIKQYLEEMFVRQIEVDNNEADDLISYYCQIAENEQITIFSGDRDLTQLISGKVSVYSPNAKKTYKMGDMVKNKDLEFPHFNIKTVKILCGDTSDNIDGIRLFGEKTLVKLFPEVLENLVSFDDILSKAETLLKEDKENVALKNLLTGRTKEGIYGEEFFTINQKIIDLSSPLITDQAKEIVNQYYSETLDPDGRGYKNLIKMMMEDGLFKYLPKKDDAWVEFLKPILKLTRKEKTKFKNQKNKL